MVSSRSASRGQVTNSPSSWLSSLCSFLPVFTLGVTPKVNQLFSEFWCYSLAARSRSALAMTETELGLIAGPAIIGLRSQPKSGCTGSDWNAKRVI
jgi:hypothetical protein